jgi:hypothetical protein
MALNDRSVPPMLDPAMKVAVFAIREQGFRLFIRHNKNDDSTTVVAMNSQHTFSATAPGSGYDAVLELTRMIAETGKRRE